MEEHPTKKLGRLERVSVFMGPDSATTMEISDQSGAATHSFKRHRKQ